MGAEGLSVIAPPKDAPVCPPAGRLHDDIAASSTEGAVLTSKVNRFGKWSTASENSKPIAGINAKKRSTKIRKSQAEGTEGFENKTLQPLSF